MQKTSALLNFLFYLLVFDIYAKFLCHFFTDKSTTASKLSADCNNSFCYFIILLVLRSKIRTLWWGEDSASFFCIKKVCTYLVSWTYADKLHTLKCNIYFHNVRQQEHKKTSSKTGFTLVCYSFRSYYIFLFKKCQTKIILTLPDMYDQNVPYSVCQ